MKSLFLRIFLWFWLAMAAVVAVLVITSPLFTRSRPGIERWRQEAENRPRTRVERVAVGIEQGGLDGQGRGKGFGRGHGGGPQSPDKVYVLDETGAEIRGDGATKEVFEIADRALKEGEEISERSGVLHLIARPVEDPDGRRFVVVATHLNPPRLIHLLDPEALSWRLAILVLVVGGLSFWLARTLTSPMVPLRRATRRLSSGDLSARVGGNVGRRRDEIGELAREFDAMAERIEGLVESQQRLLRDVSHELRSPLARLVVALELARGRAGEAAAGPLDRIEREAGRLDELIGQLLLLERLEAGTAEQEAMAVDLDGLLADVVADAGFEAASGGTEVRFEGGSGCRVVGRELLLRSAFDNVIRNAVHHTEPGTTVEVELETDDDALIVAVRDHGSGVPEDEIAKIFEPFYRVGEARDRATGGTGLGLAIAARAVRAHGGSIGAENHPEGGLVVTVRLPA